MRWDEQTSRQQIRLKRTCAGRPEGSSGSLGHFNRERGLGREYFGDL